MPPPDEKLDIAPTLDASDASLAPVRAGTGPRPHIAGADYAELLGVDPAHYAISDELARGGMGRIIRARDLRLGRSVAIKELLPGHDDVRFEREARITARLQHPSIVHVHEAGRWPSGEPFFAMKLVAGQPLDKHIAAARDLNARLALVPNVIAVVDALAYAHGEHVIHRDLKPANVLCGDYGETVVIDWGLAKDLTVTEPDVVSIGPYRTTAVGDSNETIAGSVMGTPAYMPPEQAEGDRVDARADVYSLGAILYHVLAGVAPYEAKNTEEVLARVLEAPPQPLDERVPDAPVELLAIVDKAMARDAADRFPTAKEMAAELKRFQTGQLVTSHHYTAGELMRRWLHRHRGAVAVGAIAFLVLAIVGVASVIGIVTESRRADSSATEATNRADVAALELAKAALETDPSLTLAYLAELSPGAPQWRAARTLAADAMSRGVAHVLPRTHKPITQLAFSRDGRLLAAVDELRVRVWDLTTDTFRDVTFDGDKTMGVGFTPTGDLIRVAVDGRMVRWSPTTNVHRPIHEAFGEDGDFGFGLVSPNGRWIVLTDREAAQLVDADTGKARPIGACFQASWAPDNMLVCYQRTTQDTYVRIDPTTLATRTIGDGASPRELVATTKQVWVGTYVGKLVGVSPPTARASGHTNAISAIAVLPDGAVATASSNLMSSSTHDALDEWLNDRTITISDGTTNDLVKLRGHASDVDVLAVTPDGRLASADLDGEIRIWNRTPVTTTPHDDHTTSGVVKIDAHTIAIARRGPAFEIRDLDTGRSRRIGVTERPFDIPASDWIGTAERITESGGRRFMELTDGPDDEVIKIERARDDRHWVTLDEHHHAIAWDLDHGRLLAQNIDKVAISGDGSRVATLSSDSELATWDVKTGVAKRYDTQGTITAIALSSSGAKVAAAGDRYGYIVTYERGQVSRIDVSSERYAFHALAFSPDDSRIACAHSRAIYIVDLLRGAPPLELEGYDAAVTALEVLPDNKRLLATTTDNTARVWPLDQKPPIIPRVLRGHTQHITSVELDGDAVVTASLDHTARLWDLATEVGRPLTGHDDKVVFATKRPDGRIYTLDRDDRTSLYTDALPYDELALRVRIAAATNLRRSATPAR